MTITHRHVVALVALLNGLAMLAWPDTWEPTHFATAYHLADVFGWHPIRVWGVVFVVAGASKLLWLQPWAAGLLAGVLSAWIACAIYGIGQAWARGETPPTTPTGWLWLAGAIAVVVLPDRPFRTKGR